VSWLTISMIRLSAFHGSAMTTSSTWCDRAYRISSSTDPSTGRPPNELPTRLRRSSKIPTTRFQGSFSISIVLISRCAWSPHPTRTIVRTSRPMRAERWTIRKNA